MPFHEEHKRRRSRNIAIGLFLGFMAVMFFVATIVKVQESGVLDG